MYRLTYSKATVFMLLQFLALLVWNPAVQASHDGGDQVESYEKSDMNKDGAVEAQDLAIFSSRFLLSDWSEVAWCDFYDATLAGLDFDSQPKKEDANKLTNGQSAEYYKKHFKRLLIYINDDFYCGIDPRSDPEMLGLVNRPRLLLRMAESNDGSGEIYITDPLVGSVYIYDIDLARVAELKGLDRPLGVAIDSLGNLLVGNDGRDNIEVYDTFDGKMLSVFGLGLIIMPNSITIGPDGNIYVTDSRSHRVWVFDADYNFLNSIGSPGEGLNELNFPVDTEIITRSVDGYPVQEVYIADQANERIQVFDTDGFLVDQIYPGECGMSGCEPPLLANLQSLDADSLGRLHVLDNFEAVISILDPLSGDYLGEYGEYGEGPGYLRVPYDLVITATGHPIVTSGDGFRLVVYGPQ